MFIPPYKLGMYTIGVFIFIIGASYNNSIYFKLNITLNEFKISSKGILNNRCYIVMRLNNKLTFMVDDDYRIRQLLKNPLQIHIGSIIQSLPLLNRKASI